MRKSLLQFICVFINNFSILGYLVIGYPLLFYLLYANTFSRALALIYIIYSYLTRDYKNTGVDLSRTVQIFHEYVRDYFPGKIVFLHGVPSGKQNYIFGLHPHGVLSEGFFNYPHKGDIIDNQVVEFESRFFTTNINCNVPLLKDYVLAVGGVCASEKGMVTWLSKEGGGHSGLLAVGGAREAFFNSPNHHKIVLTRRKGFCRVALKSGAWLVPSYTFGQNKVTQLAEFEKDGLISKMQWFVYNNFGFAPIVPKGEWPGQYFFVMPKRVPLITVVGAPIPVSKVENPSKEEVDYLHNKYVNNLKDLFNSEKHKYLNEPNTELEIL